ncbi:hypothetical protein GCM10028796_20960 [Ramlibacter monticola]|uniref:Baseplate J/gp47 family protein n=1 Tax=Ramlibacter monticola TaxID=1926872 RepID=A0A936YZY4_9BURK|nr:baseplate J/gp47 family protein [Ramlibacter monticola]MBL0392349.1 baseplate J/gp47 family protein [Ramlibacter monticola]
MDPVAFESLPLTASVRPALSRIDYAADDPVSLRDRLLERLPASLPGWNATLAFEGSDHARLLAELFAHLGATLCAYADQRANESYLRTAQLPRSLIDLCELIDVRLGAGASATALQAFFAKPGTSGTLPRAFRLQAPPPPGTVPASDLLFETLAALDVHASRNAMRLVGHDRSGRKLRLRHLSASDQDLGATMDAAYAGLKAGAPLVFDDGAALAAVPLSAASEVDDATVLRWAPGAVVEDAEFLIADTRVLGRAKQVMKMAAAERADEVTLGQNRLPVANAAMFTVGAAALVESGGLLMPVLVIAKDVAAKTITLNRGVVSSLRRSATRVLEGTACGAITTTIRAGSTQLWREPLGKKKDFPHTPQPGDLLLVADASGVELATVASAGGLLITLTQPLLRAMRPTVAPFENVARVRYYSIAPDDPATHQTWLRPLRLDEVPGAFPGGERTRLTLDKSYDGLAPGTVVALSDGQATQAFRVLQADSVDGKTVLTLPDEALPSLRVATLAIHGPFEHTMHVAGHDRSEQTLAAGASQLDLAGSPAGLSAGMDLVIADGAQAEGARIAQVQAIAGGARVSLARPLEHAYAIGDAVIHGNVAAIGHGAGGPDEVLGSGDTAAAPQRFMLRRTRLAFVPDPAASRGVAPAVEVFVGSTRWTLVETLAFSGPLDTHCVIEIDDRERATVVFGDGVHGATPASGRNNITARYRAGHGAVANLAAGAIVRMPQPAQFIARSLNPMAASGGADPETPEVARQRAAHRVRTLDRAVALSDHADLALTYAGIAKARADVELEGRGAGARRVVVVTCAATGGAALSTPQKDGLLAFLSARSADPVRLRVRDHRRWPIHLALRVHVLPDVLQAAVQRALLVAFGPGGFFAFGTRALGTDLALSEVYAAGEAVEGVDHVLATAFHVEGEATRVVDAIAVPADALATGGAATDATVGRFSVQLIGGLT